MCGHAELWNYSISYLIIWLFQTYTHDLELWKTLQIMKIFWQIWRKVDLLPKMKFMVEASIIG